MRLKRHFRFSIRTALLFTALVALLLSAYLHIPYATFTEGRQGNCKTLKVNTLLPMNSVLFDADYVLAEHKRIPKWQQGWLEDGEYISWNETTLSYTDSNYGSPECIILHVPFLGYRYYAITHTEDGMKFSLTSMPKKWRTAVQTYLRRLEAKGYLRATGF